MTAQVSLRRVAALEIAAPRRYLFRRGEIDVLPIRSCPMKTAETLQNPATVAVLNRRAEKTAAEAMAVLEQMFGYFSFEPLPLESAEDRLAA